VLQPCDRLILADLASFEISQHRVQLVELQLLHVEITQERSRKGAELLGSFAQPVQHRIGVDLEDPRRGADTETFSQASQDAHDQLDRRLFAVEEGAMGLQKVALTRDTVELAPGAAAGMTVGAEIAQPEPAPIVTIAVRTKVPRSVDLTGTPVGRCHGSGRHRRKRFGRRSVLFTQGAMGLVRQAFERFGLVGARALGCEGLGQSWSLNL
jgi:hypothetical protein